MESNKTENGEELTSTMGNLISDKNDVCDSTPTSSTDASTSSATVAMAEDPISSTSSEVIEKEKTVTEPVTVTASIKNTDPIVSEKDLLDMNISGTTTEEITENVDDIVQDLENLLGEPTSSIDFLLKPKDAKIAENKVSPLDIDALSVELELPKEIDNTSNIEVAKDDAATEDIPELKQEEKQEESCLEPVEETTSDLINNIKEENEMLPEIQTETKLEECEKEKHNLEEVKHESEVVEEKEITEIAEPEETTLISENVEENVFVSDTKVENLEKPNIDRTEPDSELKNKEEPKIIEPEMETERDAEVEIKEEPKIIQPEMETMPDAEVKIIEEPKIIEPEIETVPESLPSEEEKIVEENETALEEENVKKENLEDTEQIEKEENVESVVKIEKPVIQEPKIETIEKTEQETSEELNTIAGEVKCEEINLNNEKITEIPSNIEESLPEAEELETKETPTLRIEEISENQEEISSSDIQAENKPEILKEVEETQATNIPSEENKNSEEEMPLPQELEEKTAKINEIFAEKEPELIIEAPVEILRAVLQPESSSQEILNAVSSIGGSTLNLDDNLEEAYQNQAENVFTENEASQKEDNQNMEILLAVSSIPNIDETSYALELPESQIQPTQNRSTVEISNSLQIDKVVQSEEKIKEREELIEEKTEIKTDNVTQLENKLKQPLVINIGEVEKERPYSPKITIKPIRHPDEDIQETDEREVKGSIKMTITKQSNTMHSILKIYNPEEEPTHLHSPHEEQTVPRLIIKPIMQPNEQQHSPKVRSSKVYSPSSSGSQRSASPRITIKPIKPPDNLESISPLKITIKPVLKPEERQKHSPKLTIKPIIKPPDEEEKVHSPRVTIKPIIKPSEAQNEIVSTPKVTIKPLVKPQEAEKPISPKITIKPIVRPPEEDLHSDEEESVKERIVLKINKGNIQKPQEEEKLAKIKLKFSKEGGHPHIVQEYKRAGESSSSESSFKKQKTDHESLSAVASPSHSKLKEMLCATNFPKRGDYSVSEKIVIEDDDDDVSIVEENLDKTSPIIISEESNQDSVNNTLSDPVSDIPVFEITPESVKASLPPPVEIPVTPVAPTPRKRGRPRKVPLEVREDFKDVREEEPKPVVVESTRPKRSCRGQSVRTTLGIKPRKPRGPGRGRGRGSKRGMGTRATPTPPATPPRAAKEPRLSAAKLRQVNEQFLALSRSSEFDDSYLAPPESSTDNADIVMYEEETRMSAETSSSRAQTPAKQVTIATVDLVEESQSSVQSTSESAKARKASRFEVPEPEGAVISADQLAEYYWSGGGPYMLQEQVAQFLGIKSFKRKYPNIPRRVVDMQERDFIRESGLAGESMCDLGLTAVNSTDILDIMYSDFQDKYEEYCKHQRDRQAKDLTNKQKALSLAASQEKTKLDITQQAVQSAASWNSSFNRTRKDSRKACMDLQTLTVHFPKGKVKQLNRGKTGSYPVALVPGQFTDYYRELSSRELSGLPLNTLDHGSAKGREMECDSQTDGSGSESESSSSDSDSSYSGSSDDDCTLCKPATKRLAAV